MSEQQPSPLESQIVELERVLAQKRAEAGIDIAAPIERGEVHEVLGEQIQEVAPEHPIKPVAQEGEVPSWEDPALVADIQDLVNIAFTQSVPEAIAKAEQTKNPALIDALHDVLVDRFHPELVERKKLQPTP